MGVIIVGIDGSEISRRALDEAVRIAAERGHDVRAVHVVQTASMSMYPGGIADLATRLLDEGRRLADDELRRLHERLPASGDVGVESVVAHGHAGVELVDAAADTGDGDPAAMLVLGSRGHGGIKSLLLGSIATYVLHHLPCPVLVIPAESD